jgi:MEDS: MEthanogen/methylotroph, DcmR Sensory domain
VWSLAEPLTEQEALPALRDSIPDLGRCLLERRIEILRSQTRYFTGDSLDLQKVARGWDGKLAEVLKRGYEGMRVAAAPLSLMMRSGRAL